VTGRPDEIGILSLVEALRLLESPYGLEELATLTGVGVLLVDLPAEQPAGSPLTGLGQARIERARELMGQLACPSIAICGEELSPLSRALLPAFDLVVEDGPQQLEQMLTAIHTHPQATLALVQLLRHNEQLDVHEGLIAESLVYSTLQSGMEFAAWQVSREPGMPVESGEPAVLVERSSGRLTLSLNRPERHNAFSLALRDALVEGLQLALSDDRIREIVLRGEGRSFCSGGDLDEFGSFVDPATAHAVRSTRNPARLLARLAARTRAEVHGACIGAGVELPAFVAHVVARPDAFFALPEVGMGLVPGAGGTVSLPRRIGRQRTAYLAITGQRLDVGTAHEWGIVDEVAPG
jgi:hypothetical protein